ncbi:MAG: Zn-ribbon domain-containing OB-fold protein [Burkholderiaceae bacterium]|nr:Zn-ribbon domain-containing OB-fold protein [Burkholderiaceae bacterium]
MRRIDPGEAHVKPLPTPDSDSRAYWQGLKDGQLLLQHCTACGHVQFYQQAICRHCGSESLEHRAASGRGTVHSFSVVHRAPGPAFKRDTPYAVLLVELAEGPRMISSLVDADPMAVQFDMPVELVCEAINDQVVLPRFRPIRG